MWHMVSEGLQNFWKRKSNYYRICKASSRRCKTENISIAVDTDRRETILLPIESPERELSIGAKIIFVSQVSPELLRYLVLRSKFGGPICDSNFEIFCSPGTEFGPNQVTHITWLIWQAMCPFLLRILWKFKNSYSKNQSRWRCLRYKKFRFFNHNFRK